MVLGTLGSIGLGLVWGWFAGNFTLRQANLWRPLLLIGLGTLALALLVIFFLDRYRLAHFAGAVALTCLLHIGWRRQLTRH